MRTLVALVRNVLGQSSKYLLIWQVREVPQNSVGAGQANIPYAYRLGNKKKKMTEC